jgi:hypothetical protein
MNTKALVVPTKLSTPGVECPVVDRKLVSTLSQLEVSIPGRPEIDLVESNL